MECAPLCTIEWLKNDEIIAGDDILYTIEENIVPENPDTNMFTSVLSRLSWNLENFPGNKLDHNELNFTISCQVDESDIGLSLSSTSLITVECEFYSFCPTHNLENINLSDGPENVELSTSFMELEEGEVMEPVLCSADASPEPSFVWKYNGEVVLEDNVLEFSEPIKRYIIFYFYLGNEE